MAPAPRRPSLPRIDLQNTYITHPVGTAPLTSNMEALLGPPIHRLPARILLADPAARARMDTEGQAAILLAVPQDPAARRGLLPQPHVAEEDAALEHQSEGRQGRLGWHEQACPICAAVE